MTVKDERPSWNEYFMNVAHEVAKRSTCERAQVGAVIVKDKRILTTGYNGSPRGLPHCTDVGCLMDNGHCVRTLHAEQNAIIVAALHGVITEGATIYITHQPCFLCAKMIINAGIIQIVYDKDYPDDRASEFLEQAGVELIVLN
jgi:dCMP deaminase